MAFYCKICCDLLSSKPPSEPEVGNNNNETEGDENEGKLTVTACGHAFHSTCFSRWIKVSEKSKCCPNCLLVIRTDKIHALYLDTGMDRLQDSGMQESASAEVIMREATKSKILAHLRLELQKSLDGIAELETGERRILLEVGNASKKGINGAALRQHVSRGRGQRVTTGGTSARSIGQDMEQKMSALSFLEEQAVASRKICVEIFKVTRFLENAIARAVTAARERETAVRRAEPQLGAHPSGTLEASVTSCPSSEGSSGSGGSGSVVRDESNVVAGSSRPVTLARVRLGPSVAAAVRPARTAQLRPLVARSSSQASVAGMRGGRNLVEVSTSSRSGGSRWRN